MGKFKIRYLVGKRQKGHTLWYWQPSKELAALGWSTRRLAERTNDLTDAIQQAEKLNAELDAWRAGLVQDPTPPEGSLPWLIKQYQHDAEFKKLATATQRGYLQNFKVIEGWSERAGNPAITTLTRAAVKTFYKSMEGTPFKANAVLRVLRLLLNYAMDWEMISANPAAKPKMVGTPPRDAIWSARDIDAFVKAANEVERPSMALAVLIGAYLGQRQGDILSLGWSQYDGHEIKLRQRKTKKLMEVPTAEVLRAALNASARCSTQIVASEATSAPYLADNFRHLFREIADKAGLKHLRFQDLRRTAAVRLAEVGCTAIEIAAITGHDIDTTQRILEVYVPRTATMARNAIAKLEGNKSGPVLEG